MIEPTTEEKQWIKRFRRCLKEKPTSMNIHIENIGGEFQFYHGSQMGDFELLDIPSFRSGFTDGDPLDD